MIARRVSLLFGLALVGCVAGNVPQDTPAVEHLYQSEQEAWAPRAEILALKRAGKARRSKRAPGWPGEPPPRRIPTQAPIESRFETAQLWSNAIDWEPAIAVDRTSSYVYQMTNRYGVPECASGCPDPAIILRRSSDGGNTWGPDRYVLRTVGSQYDPQIEVADNGVLYAALMDNFNPGVIFIKSLDRGETWSEPIPMSGPGTPIPWSDKPLLTVSRDGKDVYLAFNSSHSFVAASHDYGETWQAPIKTNRGFRYWFHSGGAVAANGDVYFASSDYTVDFSGVVHISIIRSVDGGKSWTTYRVDTSAEVPDCKWAAGCYLGYFGPQADVAVDSAGTVMVAYNASDLDGAPQSLYVKTSTNGVDWSERILISPPFNNALAGFPALASGTQPGDFRVVWIDDRNGSETAFNVWYRQTSDGGKTWSAVARLSNARDGAVYKTADGFAFPYGDYLEIGVDGNGALHAIWGEGISYDDAGGTWYTRVR